MNIYFNRMLRAAKLDAKLYEEVEADRSSILQAMGVVILSSVAAGIGSLYSGGGVGFISGIFAALFGWLVWALLTYFIGAKLFPESGTQADYGQLLRTTGFSSAPGLIRVLGIIPGLTSLVFWVAGIWMLVTMTIAVRQALDYQSTLRAVGVCALGWLIQMAALALMFYSFGGATPFPAPDPILFIKMMGDAVGFIDSWMRPCDEIL